MRPEEYNKIRGIVTFLLVRDHQCMETKFFLREITKEEGVQEMIKEYGWPKKTRIFGILSFVDLENAVEWDEKIDAVDVMTMFIEAEQSVACVGKKWYLQDASIDHNLEYRNASVSYDEAKEELE